MSCPILGRYAVQVTLHWEIYKMDTFDQKLETFAQLVTEHQQQKLIQRNLACEANMKDAIAHVHYGKKYARVDVGSSGKYMIEIETERIFGIKGYGVIHRGHYYGTLDTINSYFWGRYYAIKLSHE